jgi:hypothetical protein
MRMNSWQRLGLSRLRQMMAAATDHDGRRDEVVRPALGAGLSKSEVHQLAGMARTTIDRIAGTLPAMEQDPR